MRAPRCGHLLSCISSALLRSRLRDEGSGPAWIMRRALGCFVQYPGQIAVRIKAVFLGRFDQTEDHGAALCAARRVCEQKMMLRSARLLLSSMRPSSR